MSTCPRTWARQNPVGGSCTWLRMTSLRGGGGVMAEDEDPEIAAALAKLAEQDAAAADDARAALEWMAGDQGLAFITQARIQNFCWSDLLVEWLIRLDDHVR